LHPGPDDCDHGRQWALQSQLGLFCTLHQRARSHSSVSRRRTYGERDHNRVRPRNVDWVGHAAAITPASVPGTCCPRCLDCMPLTPHEAGSRTKHGIGSTLRPVRLDVSAHMIEQTSCYLDADQASCALPDVEMRSEMPGRHV
jgi:hypothetical protein